MASCVLALDTVADKSSMFFLDVPWRNVSGNESARSPRTMKMRVMSRESMAKKMEETAERWENRGPRARRGFASAGEVRKVRNSQI
ncbi:uncharacterized protein LOC143893648 isoform X2 [Temnothorax americanus]|uniref:uncharacterized protein LOC143893648 isoform X2 n=1 Tax=Temnothorax americanus TaxID=1964332 RepID=UPI0040694043